MQKRYYVPFKQKGVLFFIIFILFFSIGIFSQEENKESVFDPFNQIVRMDEIGMKIASNLDLQDIDFEFLMIPTPDLIAFACCDGSNRIFVSLELLKICNDDELAFILAHEMVHLEKRHAEKEIKRQKTTEITVWIIGSVLSALAASSISSGVSSFSKADLAQIVGFLVNEIVALGGIISIQKFSRELETEADKVGCMYAYKSGYNPEGAISFFQKLKKEEPKKKILVEILASHPDIEQRIKNINEMIQKLKLQSP